MLNCVEDLLLVHCSNCEICYKETIMKLSNKDIWRLENKGYRLEEFEKITIHSARAQPNQELCEWMEFQAKRKKQAFHKGLYRGYGRKLGYVINERFLKKDYDRKSWNSWNFNTLLSLNRNVHLGIYWCWVVLTTHIVKFNL